MQPNAEHKTKEELMIENALLRQKDDLTAQFRTMLDGAVLKLTESWDKKTEANAAMSNKIIERLAIVEEKQRMMNFKIATSTTTASIIIGVIVFILDRTIFK